MRLPAFLLLHEPCGSPPLPCCFLPRGLRERGSITSKARRRGDRVWRRGQGIPLCPQGEGQASCTSSWPGPHGFEEPRGVSEAGLEARVALDLFSVPPAPTGLTLSLSFLCRHPASSPSPSSEIRTELLVFGRGSEAAGVGDPGTRGWALNDEKVQTRTWMQRDQAGNQHRGILVIQR